MEQVFGLTIFAAAVAFVLLSVIRRIWFHPLSRVPGDKRAAATSLFGFYHNVIRRSNFPYVIQEMHETYGPIVRIGPNEVHIRGPEAYKALSNTPCRKDPRYYDIGLGAALALTLDGSEHKRRRAQLIGAFAEQQQHVESMVPGKVAQLCRIVQERREFGPLNLSDLLRSFTFDIQSVVFFGRDDNLLGSDDHGHSQHQLSRELFRQWDLIRQFPRLIFFKDKAPAFLSHRVAPVLLYEQMITRKTHEKVRAMENMDFEKGMAGVIHVLAQDPTYCEDNYKNLISEAMEVAGGAGEAIAHTMIHLLGELIEHPVELERLREELHTNEIDPLTCQFETVKNVKLLDALMKEGRRTQNGGSYRFPRIIERPMEAYDIVLPPETIVSSTPRISHEDGSVYPQPKEFDPQRWFEPTAEQTECLMVTGIGPRKCLGQRIVYHIVLRTVAQLVQNFEFSFVDTSRESRLADGFAEFFPPRSSEGLLVTACARD